jgi:hypothetical protein
VALGYLLRTAERVGGGSPREECVSCQVLEELGREHWKTGILKYFRTLEEWILDGVAFSGLAVIQYSSIEIFHSSYGNPLFHYSIIPFSQRTMYVNAET